MRVFAIGGKQFGERALEIKVEQDAADVVEEGHGRDGGSRMVDRG
jgi:hypothetical protein